MIGTQTLPRQFNWRPFFQKYGLLMSLLLLCLALSVASDRFLTSDNLLNVLRQSSINGIISIGMMMVILTRGIDLSVGSVLALSAVIGADMLKNEGMPVLQAIGICLLVGAAAGAVNGFLVSWVNIPPFIATLGMMSIARGFCYGWTKGWPFRQLNGEFRTIGQGDLPILGYDIPYPTIIMIILAIIMTIFLTRTVWGYRIYALGGNEQAAQLSGINTSRVKLLAYSTAGLMAGIGGTLMTARLGVAAPTAAQGYELDVIAAVFIGGASVKGGKGTIVGTLIGAAIMQVLRNGLNLLGADAYWQPAAIGFTIVLAIMFDRARQDPQVTAFVRRAFRLGRARAEAAEQAGPAR